MVAKLLGICGKETLPVPACLSRQRNTSVKLGTQEKVARLETEPAVIKPDRLKASHQIRSIRDEEGPGSRVSHHPAEPPLVNYHDVGGRAFESYPYVRRASMGTMTQHPGRRVDVQDGPVRRKKLGHRTRHSASATDVLSFMKEVRV